MQTRNEHSKSQDELPRQGKTQTEKQQKKNGKRQVPQPLTGSGKGKGTVPPGFPFFLTFYGRSRQRQLKVVNCLRLCLVEVVGPGKL